MKIYVDTSVINGMYADDAPWIKEATQNFLQGAQKKNYIIYVSDLAIAEIERTPSPMLRKKLLSIIDRHRFKRVVTTEKAEKLAQTYINAKIIPHKYLPDALHIAIATIHKIPVIVSWNFRHIVRHKTRIGVNELNRKKKLMQIDICSPEEVG